VDACSILSELFKILKTKSSSRDLTREMIRSVSELFGDLRMGRFSGVSTSRESGFEKFGTVNYKNCVTEAYHLHEFRLLERLIS